MVDLAGLSWALGLLGADGDRVVMDALNEACVISFDGKLDPGKLASLLGRLAKSDADSMLVWTLPHSHPMAYALGTSYVRAILEIIGSASDELCLTSPFIQEIGIANLAGSLTEALRRGTKIIMLTHQAEDLSSTQSIALEELRREAERLGGSLTIYSAYGLEGNLLHAKLVIADSKKMILGSANLTAPGLTKNLEAGVVLGSGDATVAKQVVDGFIRSGLVKLVYQTKPMQGN
jgi:phosphatidylserine/phosphatidylglycerophosphate/cardiolipin synthase-like enzyme